MNKTKKNGFLKAACMMLSATMLAACVVAGTMAKYTSNTSMSASADVAKWSIQVDGDEIQELSPKNLSFTIYDTNPSGEKVTDEEVTTGKIAPGTWGYAEIDIKNAGEVDADITAAFDKGGNLPEGMKVIPLSSVPASRVLLIWLSPLCGITIPPILKVRMMMTT